MLLYFLEPAFHYGSVRFVTELFGRTVRIFMNIPSAPMLALSLVLSLLPVPLPAQEKPAPAAQQKTVEVKKILDLLFSTRTSRLSLLNKSAAASYQFTVRMEPARAGGDPAFGITTTTLAASPQRLAIVIRNAAGLPLYFLSKGLFVAVDLQHPGGLVYFEGGNLLARFSQQGEPSENRFGMELGYNEGFATSDIDFNPGAAFRAILPRMQKADFDNQTRTLTLGLDRGTIVTVGVLPEGSSDPLGLDRLVIANASVSMTFQNFKLGDQLTTPIPTLTKAELETLGLPLRLPTPDELKQLNLIAPPGFGSDPKAKAAAEKLNRLLQ